MMPTLPEYFVASKLGIINALALVISPIIIGPIYGQENWPAFRKDGSGIVSVESVPIKWSPQKNIAWRAEITGYGQSAPVIWENTVFLTSCDGAWQEKGYIHAFDLKSGKKKWTTEVPASTKVENYFRNSRAAPTCVVDAERVISFFPGGDVTAMDHAGKKLWTMPLFKKFGAVQNERATASSLAQTASLAFVLIDHHGPSYLIALRKKDGSVAWKAERGKRIPSWSTPVIASHGGRDIVIASSADSVDAYDAQTGDLLWQVSEVQGNRIPSAAIAGDSIFIGASPPAHGKFDGSKVASSNCRIRLIEKNNQPSYEVCWSARRVNSSYSTPLAFEGYVYYVNKSGILYCLDAETGEEVYRNRIGSPCWASAIGVTTSAGRSLVYFIMKDGKTLVLNPVDSFQVVARNELWSDEEMLAASAAAKQQRQDNSVPADQAPPKAGPEKIFAGMPEAQLHKLFSYGDPTVYAAAIVEGRLLIRTGQHLYCVGSAE